MVEKKYEDPNPIREEPSPYRHETDEEFESSDRGDPAYSFYKNPTPLNIASAIVSGSLTPETEAYMRQQGKWPADKDIADQLKSPEIQQAWRGIAYSDAEYPSPHEVTSLSPKEEINFQRWIKQNNITDVNEPDSYYDYRGAYKAGVKPDENQHWPDTFKQHGHPTFSVESQYSTGPNDGGHWQGNTFIPPKVNMADDKLKSEIDKATKDAEEEVRRSKDKELKSLDTGPAYQAAQTEMPPVQPAPAAPQDYAGVPASAQLPPPPQLQMLGAPAPMQLTPPPSTGGTPQSPTGTQQSPPYTAVPQNAQLGAPPQLQQPAPIAPPNSQLPTPYGPGIPQGTTTASPTQYQQEALNLNQRQQDLELANAEAIRDATAQTVKIRQDAALENQQQQVDFQNHLTNTLQQHNERDRVVKDAYNRWVAQFPTDPQTGKVLVNDPSKAFWADRSTPSKVLSAFALFASGLGAGLQHKGGNPYLDFLNQEIARNFDAHKEAIGNLYKQQVEAGRMQDTTDNFNNWMANAKVAGYKLAADHLTNQLEGVKAQGAGQVGVNLADKTILGLQEDANKFKVENGQAQASALAGASANQRKKLKEVGDAIAAQITHLTSGPNPLPDDVAAQQAFKNVWATGQFSQSDMAAAAANSGIKWNGKAWEYGSAVAGGGTPGTASTPDNLVPAINPETGRRYTPEEREKLTELKVDTHMGPRLANSTSDKSWIQKANEANAALQNYLDTIKPFISKGKNGEDSKYDRYRKFGHSDYEGADEAVGILSKTEQGAWEAAAERARKAIQAQLDEGKNSGTASRGPWAAIIGQFLRDDEAIPKPSLNPIAGSSREDIEGKIPQLQQLIETNKTEIEGRVRPYTGKPQVSQPKQVKSVNELPSVK